MRQCFRFPVFPLTLLLALALLPPGGSAGSEDERERLQRLAAELEQAVAAAPADPQRLERLAATYLDLGDALEEQAARLAAYDAGAAAAKRALALREGSAQAHYLYAANLGSGSRLAGLAASAWRLPEIRTHVRRAVALDPGHAPAWHMLGMLLEELPRLLGGDPVEALRCLQRAVTVDPGYQHARLDLAKAYLKRNDRPAARQELERLLALGSTPEPSRSRHLDEARRLLRDLKG